MWSKNTRWVIFEQIWYDQFPYHLLFQAVLEDPHMPGNLNGKTWMVAGSGSALIAALLVYPADMLKTRLIVQNITSSKLHYRGILHGFRKVWKAEGFLALYKGLLPTFLGKYQE